MILSLYRIRWQSKYKIPAAGNCNNGSVNNVGNNGNVWSSSLNTSNPNNAWNLNFNSGNCNMNNNNRYNGWSVRGVRSICQIKYKNIERERLSLCGLKVGVVSICLIQFQKLAFCLTFM